MFNLRTLIAATAIAYATSAFAEIRETNSMEEALKEAQTGDVVVLDIDNTIAEPLQSLGSDQWYGSRVEKYKKEGLTEDQAIDRAISEWTQVQNATQVHAVEPRTPVFIRKAHRKVMVMALTARPLALKEATFRQLKYIGVILDNGALTYSDGADIEYYNGILLVGPRNNKGVVLAKFFKQLGIQPKKLIFVDDKEKHVKNMEAVFAPTGLTNINFRYGAADSKVKGFRTDITDVQWSVFQQSGQLLSDSDAEKLLTSH